MHTDIHNRPYAKLSQLNVGDIVIVDDGFTCMKRWSERKVGNELSIPCKNKDHSLGGQLMDDGDSLIGVYKKEDFTPHKADKK